MSYPSGRAATDALGVGFLYWARFFEARNDWTISADPPLLLPEKAANRREVPAATP
jgi:hypothetical protein